MNLQINLFKCILYLCKIDTSKTGIYIGTYTKCSDNDLASETGTVSNVAL